MSGVAAITGADGRSRCPWAATGSQVELLQRYHDTEWGRPVASDQALFERLTLEAFQSGLSWLTILRKRDQFRVAFDGFDPQRVAAYGAPETARLMADAGIVRNRAKIEATIGNAQALLALDDISLVELVAGFAPAPFPAPRTTDQVPTTAPESIALSKELKRRGFRFVGPTTMFALMEATGLVNTHLAGCFRRAATSIS